MPSARNLTLAELIREAIDLWANEHAVGAVPARVERFDATTNQIDAQPIIRDLVATESGTEAERPPVIPGVPLVQWGAGGFRITVPVAVGDTVLLLPARASLDKWKALGGADVDPRDPRRHHIADMIAIPGLKPFNAPWTGGDSNYITIGEDGGTFERVALAETLKTHLDSLKTWLDALILPSAAGPAGPPAVASPAVPEIRSSTVKVST